MFIYELLAWISCSTIVAGQFVFQPGNVILRNLVIDNNTGDVFVGGVNYIYKLNKNLTQLKNVFTPCLVEKCKPGATVNPNANQLLMIENLTGTPRLFACGTYKYGTCVTYDMNSFSYTVLDNTIGAVSNIQNYSSIGLEDPSNNGILIASTRIANHEDQLPKDYTLNINSDRFVCNGTVKPCIGKSKQILLTPDGKLKIYYILAVIVGKFRYVFSHNMDDGTNVARLCENYNSGSVEIKTYMEMPLRCVGKDGTNYEQLVAAKVLRLDGKLAEKFGSTGDDDDAVLIGVFQKSGISSQSVLCIYTFKQINQFFWKNIEKCSKSNTLLLSKYVQGSTCSVEVPTECSLNSKNQRMTGTIEYESEAVVTCSDCESISSMDTTSYRENIIVFLGAKDGKLSKFIIYSNSSGRWYETSNTIPGSGILSVKFDRIGEGAYLLSPDKVLNIPVEECGNRTSCESCVKGGDPYCGWCTLHATCTTYDKCSYYESPLRYVRHSNGCISIPSLSPSSLPIQKILSTTTRSINSTNALQSTSAGTNSSNEVNIANTNTTENSYSNDTSIQTSATTTVDYDSSLFPGDPTDHIIAVKKNNENGMEFSWWIILIFVILIILFLPTTLVFVVLVCRKRKRQAEFYNVEIDYWHSGKTNSANTLMCPLVSKER